MIHLLLTPDAPSAMKLRRSLAESGALSGVIAGTWPELMAQAEGCVVLPPAVTDWEEKLNMGVWNVPGAFWRRSLNTVLAEEKKAITALIGSHLAMLLEAAGTAGRIEGVDRLSANPRLQKRVEDLAALHEAMGHALPPALHSIDRILKASPERTIRRMRIYHDERWLSTGPWQDALMGHLNGSAGEVEDPQLRKALEKSVEGSRAPSGSSLKVMQEQLFTLPSGGKAILDGSLQWLRVRDGMQEMEVAAGMMQEAVRSTTGMLYADMALLLPSDISYSHAAREVFTAAGIPLSGLRDAYETRDLGGEAVLNLLYCLEDVPPAVSMASLLSSPLMPWSTVEGNRLAQDAIAIDMRNTLKLLEAQSKKAHRMLELVTGDPADADHLQARMEEFAGLLDEAEELKSHRERAGQLCKAIAAELTASAGPVKWQELRDIVQITPQAAPALPEPTREGVAVFYEGQEPWRTVRQLYAAGCSAGHFPESASASIIFTDEELEELKAATGMDMERAAVRGERNRKRFRRQLTSATEAAVFLVPGRDAQGKSLAPSSSITFAEALFETGNDRGLVLTLENSLEYNMAGGLPEKPGKEGVPPRELVPEDLDFKKNLLETGMQKDGTLKPESPSRLDTLLVSPLAWLFERLDIKAREWAPEKLDPLKMGTVAHAVFEHLFTPEGIAGAEGIRNLLPELYDNAVKKTCPFLLRREWTVERENLMQGILKASLEWSEILEAMQARVVETEISLEGTLSGVPIHGNADLLLKLDDNRMLVVDYKKSSSGSREKRMNAGWDLQAELYRTMIETGGPEKEKKVSGEAAEVLARFKSAGEIGTLYYLMNDQTALAGTKGWFNSVSGLNELGTATSNAAWGKIQEQLEALKNGLVTMNTTEDEKAFEKIGITPYAIKNNPLVRLFMHNETTPTEKETVNE